VYGQRWVATSTNKESALSGNTESRAAARRAVVKAKQVQAAGLRGVLDAVP
jgi:hypothetical protein